MLKIIVSIFLVIFSLSQAPLVASDNDLASIECAAQLQGYLKKILEISEARALIKKIQEQGPIRIKVNNDEVSRQFGAYWSSSERTICIYLPNNSEGDVIVSILFELHNAEASDKFAYNDKLACSGKIHRKDYIREVEYIEYKNTLETSKISKMGIDLGIFPKDAFLPTYNNFEEHYRGQIRGGHSAVIGRNYDYWVQNKC